MLPDEYAKPVVEYLRATRKVYELCMARHVTSDYHLHFEEFRRTFLVLRKLIGLQWTLKVHCILDHFEEYFELCGVTFRYTSGEVIESMHHNLRMMMENHNLRITDHLGSKIHEDWLLKTICLWNFKNIVRNNNPVPRSVEAIAGAVYGQQF